MIQPVSPYWSISQSDISYDMSCNNPKAEFLNKD